MVLKRDLGDFQTPPALVAAVLNCFKGEAWQRALEPTCGQGNFIAGLLGWSFPPREIVGIEIQPEHAARAESLARGAERSHVRILKSSIFELDLKRHLSWNAEGPLLVVGNPPWVTNSELGILGSDNLPRKRNLKALRGIDALTGSANFDLAEYIWVKLIVELAPKRPTIALLCKTSVARNVLQHACRAALPIEFAWIRRIDAKRWFGASVDACLFAVRVGPGYSSYRAAVYPDLESQEPERVIGVYDGELVADLDGYQRVSFADGRSPVTWRQGLKHDAASVMELTTDSVGGFRNKLGEPVNVEPEYLYPLLKATDLFRGRHHRCDRAVILTQKSLSDDTAKLRRAAPALWEYLTRHEEVFRVRKSSIYRGKPSFSVFGIGDYSFAPYKVAVSGLHKEPRFRVLGPIGGRPVMLDDACYFAACESLQQAALLSALLQDPVAGDLIRALRFWDAKRPITKKLLQRIDLGVLIECVDRQSLLARADAELACFPEATSGSVRPWPSTLKALLPGLPLFMEATRPQPGLFD